MQEESQTMGSKALKSIFKELISIFWSTSSIIYHDIISFLSQVQNAFSNSTRATKQNTARSDRLKTLYQISAVRSTP